MKHIFKKLRNHDSNRNNSTTPPTPSSSHSPNPSTNNKKDKNKNTGASSASASVSNQSSDYISSEEEFQVQLALALSASKSEEFRGGSHDKDQICAATLLSLEHDGSNSRRGGSDAAEELSRRYWEYSVLDYDDKVVDGFYDLYAFSIDTASQGKMPSLTDLQTTGADPGFEVVIVNRETDPSLEELHQVAQCIALDCSTSTTLLVQKLAELVTEHFGGPVMDANIMLAMWMEKTSELRTSLHKSMLPIGSLNIGLSRHRSLLFKALADSVGVPCRLIKGSHYTGNDDDAVNIIKLENEREFLVDLMAAPGTLIPAEILNIKDTSNCNNNPKSGDTASLQTGNNIGVDFQRVDAVHKMGNAKSLAENFVPSVNSNSETPVFVPPISNAKHGESPISFSDKFGENSMCAAPILDNQSQPGSSSLIGGCSQKKDRKEIPIPDVNENLNEVPYSRESNKDLENLFADLNPFRMVESGKNYMQNRNFNKEVDDFQKRDNIATISGRPSLPLVWENRFTCNEVPRTKQYEFVDGFGLHREEVKSHNLSPSSFDQLSDRVYPAVHNVDVEGSCVSYNIPGGRNVDIGHPTGSGDSALSVNTNQLIGIEEDSIQTAEMQAIQTPDRNLRGEYYRGGEVLPKDEVNSKKLELSASSEIGYRNNTGDGFMGTKLMSRHFGNSGSNTLDPMSTHVADWEISWENLVIGERIGLGSYGEVFRADWKGKEVAVKKFLDQDFSGDALDEFRSEVRIMRRLHHPNVVRFLGAVTQPPNLSIVTEFLPRGSLYRILHHPHSRIDEKHRIKMAIDVAEGMNCLHTSIPTIVHRDLKSPNLLVDENWNVKVCDFGLSRLKHNTFLSSKSTAGTPEWMAPEVLRNEQSNEKCDVYSFGVILWELATLRMPWSGLNAMQVVGAVGFQNCRLEIPKEVDPLVAKIILECCQRDSNLRPSFAQLTTTLKSLKRLVVPSQQEQQNLHLLQESSVNSTL